MPDATTPFVEVSRGEVTEFLEAWNQGQKDAPERLTVAIYPELRRLATRTEHRVMTPNYASPEQLLGQPITPGTDVWALGVLLFELLTGRRPFDWAGMSLVDIGRSLELGPGPKASTSLPMADYDTARIARRRGLDPGRLQSHLRGDLDKVIARALASKPEERYGSVEALALDLESYLVGVSNLARRTRVVWTVGKFIRRHVLTVTALAIGMFCLVGSSSCKSSIRND